MEDLYDADGGRGWRDRALKRIHGLALGWLLLPPLLIFLSIYHQRWHFALLAPILLPLPTAYLAVRAKRESNMVMCYCAFGCLVLTMIALLAGLGALQP
ncbi:hypothetical protein [Streptomyces sp. NPDC101150]|uniref:hypothetical protein n=1 Tax=Streptomyces sp. NPDC101150 TaxID=3366114 RepID=UPI00382D94E9